MKFEACGVYRRDYEEEKTIVLSYAGETHKKTNKHSRIIFVSSTRTAIKFVTDSVWVADSQCTSGYDPGNTGYGYDEFVSNKIRKSAIKLSPEKLVDESTEGYVAVSDDITFSWSAKQYHLINSMNNEEKKQESDSITFDGSLNGHKDIAGIYTRHNDLTAPGEDYNIEDTTITIKEDCSATYVWEKSRQGGSSLPTTSKEEKSGKVVSAKYSTRCDIDVTIHGGENPKIETTAPPTLSLSFEWSTGFSGDFDLSKFEKKPLS